MNTEKFVRKWAKTKQKGKKKYVLTAGTTSGIAMFAGYSIGRLVKGNFFDLFTEYYVYMHLAYLAGGFLGGVIVSLARWDMNQEKYNRLINNK